MDDLTPEELGRQIKHILAQDLTINLVTMLLAADTTKRYLSWGSEEWCALHIAWQWLVEVLEDRYDLDRAMGRWAANPGELTYTEALLVHIPEEDYIVE